MCVVDRETEREREKRRAGKGRERDKASRWVVACSQLKSMRALTSRKRARVRSSTKLRRPRARAPAAAAPCPRRRPLVPAANTCACLAGASGRVTAPASVESSLPRGARAEEFALVLAKIRKSRAFMASTTVETAPAPPGGQPPPEGELRKVGGLTRVGFGRARACGRSEEDALLAPGACRPAPSRARRGGRARPRSARPPCREPDTRVLGAQSVGRGWRWCRRGRARRGGARSICSHPDDTRARALSEARSEARDEGAASAGARAPPLR
jgi:hypothetical protein